MGILYPERMGYRAIAILLLFIAATPVFATSNPGYGPGRVGLKILAGRDHVEVGTGGIWNSRDQLHVQLDPATGWRIKGYHVDLGGAEDYSPPLTPTGNPQIGLFDFQEKFAAPYANPAADEDNAYRRTLVLDLVQDLGFQWGVPWADQRTQGVAIFVDLALYDENGVFEREAGAWVVPELIVWEDDLTEEGAVEGEDVVADAGTGEIVADAINLSKGRNLGRGQVARNTHQRAQRLWEVDTSEQVIEFEGGRWGWWFKFTLGHPMTGHFIDSPVAGLLVETPTYEGITGIDAAYYYFPGEYVQISLGGVYLGAAVADQKISPLDVFGMSDTEDPRVVNLARLLQSLDIDGDPQGGIVITEEIVGCFEQAVQDCGLEAIDFADDALVENLLNRTSLLASTLENPVYLVIQTPEDAVAHLSQNVNNNMFRKNVSQTPEFASAKSKMASSAFWYPALPANAVDGTEVKTLQYYDEDNLLIREMTEAHPIVITYTDNDDVYAAVSMDDGETYKRMNLSRTADLSSFTTAAGDVVLGACKKPVLQVKNNKILVSWTSKYCIGGKPRYSIDTQDDYPFDDAYHQDDIWGVGGPQRSHDYAEDDFPEIGEVPYSSVWVCRGVLATATDVAAGVGQYVGDIVWFKPERLTSGRRDPLQIFMGAGTSAGFAILWQEDPEGLMPGKESGPGEGWSGATTNHKTDIWYSYLGWSDHSRIDVNFVAGGDPQHDLDVASRPKALVPMFLPMRLSDNEVINTDNILVELGEDGLPVLDENGNYIPLLNEDALSEEGDGTHRYATVTPGLIQDWHTFVNNDGTTKTVAVTADDRLLDGDTGASRPNIFLQPYSYVKTDAAGNPVFDSSGNPVMLTSAWAIICYEETKGAGSGPDEELGDQVNTNDYIVEEGKNVIYHSFDFRRPEVCAEGGIVNMPEIVVGADGLPVLDDEGCVMPKYLTDEWGNQILDFRGKALLAYENARRGRFLPQGLGTINLAGERIAQAMVFKQGPEGSGRPSDIMLVKWVVPETDVLVGTVDQPIPDNPYRFENIAGQYVVDAVSGKSYWRSGRLNMSSVTPTEVTPSAGDPEVDDAYGAVKVVKWTQSEANFNDLPNLNPFDDARAHRGTIRGDVITVGFTYTANWAAARNGNDKYDFYVRRSFNGGRDWTAKPEALGGQGVSHCITWTHPSGTETPGVKEEECFDVAPGGFERMRNLSQLPNNEENVLEPRIVQTPGTYKVNGVWTGVPEDKVNLDVYYVSFGTCTNPKKDPVTGEQDAPVPLDLYYSFTRDLGENYYLDAWVVNPDSDGNYAGETVYRWGWLANGDQQQGEAQLRMTPDGSKFYACWLDEGAAGSDIVNRRIMSGHFPQNHGAAPVVTTSSADFGSVDDYSSDAGGDLD